MNMNTKTPTQTLNHRNPWRTLLGMTWVLIVLQALCARANITVTTLDDTGPGSLRQAIADAAPGDTIDFAVDGTITLTSGELLITNDLTIAGPGATNLTVSGNNASRVFFLTNVTATISGLRIANGQISSGIGGGIASFGGLVTVANCTVSDNYAVQGGGIAQDLNGTLHLLNSAVTHNTTAGGMGGGGVFVIYSTLTVTNSTISANVSGVGGGIYAQSCTNVIVSSTVCSNLATTSQSGGIHLPYSGLFMANTVVYGNKAPAWPDGGGGLLNSGDHNLIGNTNGANITGVTTHNIYGKDPLLGPLADNGGPTPTHALLPGSPAIDHGSSGDLATDQRGKLRPCNFASISDTDDGSDIGAYELQGRSVTTLDDSGPGSLRQAIADAAPGDTIDFAVTGTITLTNGQLVLEKDLTINGPGTTNITVSGNNASRVFFITNSTVTVAKLTIADGNSDAGSGVCISSGNATIRDSTITRNAGYRGGGIFNDGRLTIISSTISSNWGHYGGGISGQNYPSETAIINCTVSGNEARELGAGGGICLQSYARMTLSNCTVSANSAYNGGGIAAASIYPLALRNSVVAGNSATLGPDCWSSGTGLDSQDYNFIANTNGCVITGATTHDIYNQDPMLGPLADNGGPTMTHALLPGSPAIDAGLSGRVATDQRGQARPVDFPLIANAGDGDGSDIGAYEVRDLPQTGPLFTVNSTDDVDDGVPGVLHCSLREAIAYAAPGDTIDFAVTGTITLTSGELVITNDLTINGPGATNLTVSGNNASRVFSFNSVTASISGLTVANGRPSTYGGAGINNTGGSLVVSNCSVTANSAGMSGGIYNNGNLTVIGSIISDNYDNVVAGGIYSPGTLKLINSTLGGNSCAGGGAYGAGGLYMAGTGYITNTTISGNRGGEGGGILSYRGMLWLCNSTVHANQGRIAQIYVTASSTLHLFNALVAGNTNRNGGIVDLWVNPHGSSLISHDYNLIGNTIGATITGVTTHDLYGVDPLLGPLAENGGPTPTHALLPGSPAIDHGSSGGLATDQRGLPRPFNFPAYYDADDGSDIGAYELQERAQTGPVFTVNSNDDADDGVPGIAHCSLREAIAAANANLDTNTIDFAAEVPSVHSGVTGTITLTNGQLTISNSVNINGPGAATLTVSGNNASRVFDMRVLGSPLPIALSGLTIEKGNADPTGSGIGDGGGIQNSLAQLTINNCVLRSNRAHFGGGINNYGSGVINLFNSTVCSNSSSWQGGGIGILNANCHITSSAVVGNTAGSTGGGILSGGFLAITNSTISGNVASLSIGGGGGIAAAFNRPPAVIRSCTISSNAAYGAGGFWGVADIANSIIAGNNGGPSDVQGALNSFDYNLIQDTNGCTITNLTAHNIYNQDPKLGPLADLGGPTPTHALSFDSPAIDAGHGGGLTTDQRGLPRPIDDPNVANAGGGDGSDIGAYEADPNLRFMPIEKVGNDIRLRFNTVMGMTYRIEYKDSLENPWTTLFDNIPGTGSALQAVDVGAASLPRRFYRVVAVLDPASGLVAHWIFSGNANDLTTNANNGEIASAVFVADRHGVDASALDFNGSNSYVSVPDSPSLNIANGISICLWLNARSLPTGGARTLIAKSDYSSHTDYLVRLLPGGDLQWEYERYHETSTHPINTNHWHHVVVTAESPNGAKWVYVDGSPVAYTQRGSSGSHGTVPNPLTIGCAGYWSSPWHEHFDGAIDDVRMYNRVLNQTEVISIYNKEK